MESPPHPISFPLGSSMKEIGPGLGRRGESVFIGEEPGVSLIYRGGISYALFKYVPVAVVVL